TRRLGDMRSGVRAMQQPDAIFRCHGHTAAGRGSRVNGGSVHDRLSDRPNRFASLQADERVADAEHCAWLKVVLDDAPTLDEGAAGAAAVAERDGVADGLDLAMEHRDVRVLEAG